MPDVHLVWDGIPIWLELKVSKGNAVNISPHQIAWHMAYHARGGLSFYLVKRSKDRDILLFGGDQGPMVLDLGCLAPCALRVDTVPELFCALRPLLLSKVSCALVLRPDP